MVSTRCFGRHHAWKVATLLSLGLVAGAQSPPVLRNAILVGGPGDQRGISATVQGGQLFVAGWTPAGAPLGTMLLHGFAIPPTVTPAWTQSFTNVYPYALVATPAAMYMAGGAYPPGFGASDGVGGTESKTAFGSFNLLDGSLLVGRSENLFPYRGGENYFGATTLEEGGQTFVFAAGFAEQMGWACSFPYVLAKYSSSGAYLGAVSEPGVVIGTNTSPYPWLWNANYGVVMGLTTFGGYLYGAGGTRMTGLGDDNVGRPVLMKFDSAMNRVWRVRANPAPGYVGYSGQFMAAAPMDGHVYAVGSATPDTPGSNPDFLVEKFDPAGNRIWTARWGTPYIDSLTGVVAVGNRLFAVGYSMQDAGSNADAVLFELDPATGSVRSSIVYGGALDDRANAVASNGQDLFVVGESRSFATAEGNSIGQSDLLILHYGLNRSPVAEAGPDQILSASAACSAKATLNAGASSDPDGDSLTYAWSWAGGSATGATPTLDLARGNHTITLTVEDGKGGSATDTLVVRVNDTAPPVIAGLPPSLAVPYLAAAGTPVALPAATAMDNCDGPVAVTNNAPALFPPGATVVTFSASDTSGNTATVALPVQVCFGFDGYLVPIRNDGTSLFNSGRTIPIKFRLLSASGTFVPDAVASLQVFQVLSTPLGTVEVPEDACASGASNVGNAFRYDPVSNQYIYNLSTKGYAPGTYVLRAMLNDGSTHAVNISLR